MNLIISIIIFDRYIDGVACPFYHDIKKAAAVGFPRSSCFTELQSRLPRFNDSPNFL